MCPKNKIAKFEESKTFPNMIQLDYHTLVSEGCSLKGAWRGKMFFNDLPLVLELGCGKGEYTVGLAERYPEKNFIGVDLKGARMWRGCKTAHDQKLKNVAFVRTKIEMLTYFFAPNEVDEIWITFPDPQPKKSWSKRRLTSKRFLGIYKNCLKKGGVVHLKTDDKEFYDYTLETIAEEGHHLIYQTNDIYDSGFEGDVMGIVTFYEKMWLKEKKKINYLEFSLNYEG